MNLNLTLVAQAITFTVFIWVTVKFMVKVPVLPSVIVTSLMESEGKAAAKDAAGGVIGTHTAAASRTVRGRQPWSARGRRERLICSVLLTRFTQFPRPWDVVGANHRRSRCRPWQIFVLRDKGPKSSSRPCRSAVT